jgi:predicted metalloprotease with PDZ domain
MKKITRAACLIGLFAIFGANGSIAQDSSRTQLDATGGPRYSCASPIAAYTLGIDASFSRIEVEGRLAAGVDRVAMADWGAEWLDDGWATFVRDLEASAADRQPLSVEPDGPAAWRIEGAASGPVTLRYVVDLSFTREPWPFGNERAGQFTGDAVYLVAQPVFIAPVADGPMRVRFEVPAEWTVSTPWPLAGTEPRTWCAADLNDLLRNSFVAGRHSIARVDHGDFTVTLALPGEAGAAAELFVPVLSAALDEYAEIFGELPERNFLMTFFYQDTDNGESFAGSATFITRDSVDAEGVMLWGNFIAHELFHFWNAQRFRSSERPATRWFSEGATEYIANRALVRRGIISPEQWLKKAEVHVAMYMLFRSSPVWNGMTLAEAGGATSRNRPGVYSGGWVASLCLDAEIRVATADRAGLADVMARLDERFGAAGTRYPAAALVEAASRVAGRDLGPYFRRYIESDETLPVRDCLATFGLAARLKPYAGEAYIWEDPARAAAWPVNARTRWTRAPTLDVIHSCGKGNR